MCVTSSGFESILEPAQANAGFYSKPPVKHSSKIALAIATSATTIKAKEMCGSESSEKQPKKKIEKRQVKMEMEGEQSSAAVAALIALMPGRGTGALQVWGLGNADPLSAAASQSQRKREVQSIMRQEARANLPLFAW